MERCERGIKWYSYATYDIVDDDLQIEKILSLRNDLEDRVHGIVNNQCGCLRNMQYNKPLFSVFAVADSAVSIFCPAIRFPIWVDNAMADGQTHHAIQ